MGNSPHSKKPKSKSEGFLSAMVQESDAYSSMELIERTIEKGLTLSGVPIQPLYLAIKSLNPQVATQYLERMSVEQRQILQDMDLWVKDELDPEEFEFWIQSYASCLTDEIREEFVTGIDFLLYLKGRFNIWSFDLEDPQYPDHDNYFLTEDNLLLFEFFGDFPYVDEVRSLIRDLYAVWGVERAYTHLFKMVAEDTMVTIEDEYQEKRKRLRDFGFVDYYDALDLDQPFINHSLMDQALKKKQKIKVSIDSTSQQQILPKKALIPFREGFGSLEEDLAKVEDSRRRDYLQFNFLRLVNGNISLQGSYKDGALAINRAGEKTKQSLLLGHDYLKFLLSFDDKSEGELFERFDLSEVFRVGNSLLKFHQKDLKKALQQLDFRDGESFLGQVFNDYIDFSFETPVRFQREGEDGPQVIDRYADYESCVARGRTFMQAVPFIKEMGTIFFKLKDSGQLQDHFYFNYNVDEIDFEAILLSSYAQHLISEKKNNQSHSSGGKLGLTWEEFKEFIKKDQACDKKGREQNFQEFLKTFGLQNIAGMASYLFTIYESQLTGYDFQNMEVEEFAHVGGPILFVPQEFLS